MIEIIQKRHQELIAGLAELLMSKNDIEKKIEAQHVAISECSLLIKQLENKEVQQC